MPEELKALMADLLMAQYQDGMRDGMKVIRESLRDVPSVTDEVRALIDAIIELGTEEAEKASQKIHAL